MYPCVQDSFLVSGGMTHAGGAEDGVSHHSSGRRCEAKVRLVILLLHGGRQSWFGVEFCVCMYSYVFTHTAGCRRGRWQARPGAAPVGSCACPALHCAGTYKHKPLWAAPARHCAGTYKYKPLWARRQPGSGGGGVQQAGHQINVERCLWGCGDLILVAATESVWSGRGPWAPQGAYGPLVRTEPSCAPAGRPAAAIRVCPALGGGQ